MIDNEIAQFAPSAEHGRNHNAPAQAAANHAMPKRHYVAEGFKNRTLGEKKFNVRTYIELGYFGSIAASLGLTLGLRDAPGISPWYNGLKNNIANCMRGSRDAVAFGHFSKRINSFLTIATMFVGTTLITIFPIKWREDKKDVIVKQYDNEIYGADRVQSDPVIRQAHAEMEAAPKQTWRSILSSRGLALVATAVTGFAIGTHIDRISIGTGRWLHSHLPGRSAHTINTIRDVAAQSPGEILRATHGPADTITSRIASYIALDAFYTVITSSILFVFTRVFAPIFDKNIHNRVLEENRQQHQTHPASALAETVPQSATGPAATIRDAAMAGRIAAARERAATV